MKEETNDSRMKAAQNSGNDVTPVQPPVTPHEKASEGCNVQEPSASPSSPKEVIGKPRVSAQKLEANKKNAQKSTGPRTEDGKAKSATNSHVHGFFAKHLFPTAEQAAKDKSDYLAVANGVHNHYQPVGYWENFWVEKISTEALRIARLLGYEQTVMMSWRNPFWESAADKILRYQTTANRRFTEAIEQLERLQAKRKAETASLNLLRPEIDDTDAEPEGLGSAFSVHPPPPKSGGTNPPSTTDSNESTVDPAQEHPHPNGPCADGFEISKNGGTNPHQTLAEIVTETLGDVGL
ncbi:MAG: hypothetical protein WCD43_15630 [Candidatus Acidiferrales bacterium]